MHFCTGTFGTFEKKKIRSDQGASMEGELIKSLLDYGLGGLFLGYLIWMSFRNERKLTEKEKSYQERIDAIRSESTITQEKIRSRYADVIQEYNAQIGAFSEERQTQIQTYAEERQEARRINQEIRSKLDLTLQSIQKEVSNNGTAIARLQEQVNVLIRAS